MNEEDDLIVENDSPELEDISNEPEVIQEANEEDELYDKIYRKVQKNVKKRIDKLVYERETEKERRERETAELKAELEALRQDRLKDVEERTASTFEQQRKDLLERRKESLEIGDYDALNEIDEQLMDIKLKAKEPERPQQAPPEPAPQQAPPEPNQALADWQAKNRWIFDQNQKGRLAKADKVFQEVLADGFDIDEPETYAEIDKRLKREVPPPAGAPDRGQVTGGDRKFTDQDRKDMMTWGLDPTDVKARQMWIKNKG